MRLTHTPLLDELTELTEFLMRNDVQGQLIALLLKEGRYYSGSKKWSPRCGWRKGPAKQCYRNSYMLTCTNPGRYAYCEGYAMTSLGRAIEHAWVEDQDDGLVIDRTLTDCTEYLGFRFKFQSCCQTMIETGFFAVFGNLRVLRRLVSEPEFRLENLL
jgi:hypothetical protein